MFPRHRPPGRPFKPPVEEPPPAKQDEEEDEEEDYMSMTFTTSKPSNSTSLSSLPSHTGGGLGLGLGAAAGAPETSLQRRARLEREGRERGIFKSKAQIKEEEIERREEVLERSLLEDREERMRNRGFRMMERMGFRGGALGKKTEDGEGKGGEGGGKQAEVVGPDTGDKLGGGDRLFVAGQNGHTTAVERENPGLVKVKEKEQDTATKTTTTNHDNPATKDSSTKSHAITEPIRIATKPDRAGIGHDTERKRKLPTTTSPNHGTKKPKVIVVNESDFRDRMRREREAERNEKLVRAAMRIAETIHDEHQEAERDAVRTTEPTAAAAAKSKAKAEAKAGGQDKGKGKEKGKGKGYFKTINVLWRALAIERHASEQDTLRKRELEASLSLAGSRIPTHGNVEEEEDGHDRMAMGITASRIRGPNLHEAEGDGEEDKELAEFNALDPEERLGKLVGYLRGEYCYCFWCKYRYPDQEMEGCPGLTEEEHD